MTENTRSILGLALVIVFVAGLVAVSYAIHDGSLIEQAVLSIGVFGFFAVAACLLTRWDRKHPVLPPSDDEYLVEYHRMLLAERKRKVPNLFIIRELEERIHRLNQTRGLFSD